MLGTGGKHTQKKIVQRNLNDPHNNYGMVGHLDPYTLKCEVTWVLGSISRNKVNEGNGIPTDLIKTLLKCCIQFSSKFGKLSNGHRTRKHQFSLQSQRRAMKKNVQITTNYTIV